MHNRSESRVYLFGSCDIISGYFSFHLFGQTFFQINDVQTTVSNLILQPGIHDSFYFTIYTYVVIDLLWL
jgi:hypothetical protein